MGTVSSHISLYNVALLMSVDVVPLMKTAGVVENCGHCIYSIGLVFLKLPFAASFSNLCIYRYIYIVYVYIYILFCPMYVYIYILYVPDEGSLLPKYRDCTTSNDFESYLMCCGVMLQ